MLLFHQIETLTPVAEAAKQFTKDYKCFAAAVNTTRHKLPVKNFYISGDGKEFLGTSCFFFNFFCKCFVWTVLDKTNQQHSFYKVSHFIHVTLSDPILFTSNPILFTSKHNYTILQKIVFLHLKWLNWLIKLYCSV